MLLGWINFLKDERNKVLNVNHLLDEPGAVDKLGIGAIRDAFADYFPRHINSPNKSKVFPDRAICPYFSKRQNKLR